MLSFLVGESEPSVWAAMVAMLWLCHDDDDDDVLVMINENVSACPPVRL
jgi:hypothetical protein